LLDQDPVIVFAAKDKAFVTRQTVLEGMAGSIYEETIIDAQRKVLIKEATLSVKQKIYKIDSGAFGRYTFTPVGEGPELAGFKTKKVKTVINSNTIELVYTDKLGLYAGPTDLGVGLGLVLAYERNGNSGLRATKVEALNAWPFEVHTSKYNKPLDALTYSDMLWKKRFVQVPIFSNAQISFQPGIPSDSILRFAEGTVILKRVQIPEVAKHSQAFIQLIEKSNGDAYDRTGSVFLIAEDQKQSFLDGMRHGMKTLPRYDAGDTQEYWGMVRTDSYAPIYELMRFFTPFGVKHFNDRLQLKGKTWQDSVIYRQDVSEFLPVLSGKTVYIGTYIGNYDKGGHTVSLELTIHPGASNYALNRAVMALFNTTNVMEMGGQGYATLFAHENGLTVNFTLSQDVKNAKLRYITTGHGGWWAGDEFVPKANSIFLDGKQAFRFTPWRVDCGSYRLYNPVSGNFENGLSSSDLSRSNWCPATVTNPVYIDLGDLKAGPHTIRVHIPQGPQAGNSFSFWNVSGALLYD